jgi:DNA-binding transcriptional regulator YiaG
MKQWTPTRIKDFRKSFNLNQNAFGLKLGVTARYIIYLEKGVKRPGKTLKLFLDCLEKEVTRERKGKGV